MRQRKNNHLKFVLIFFISLLFMIKGVVIIKQLYVIDLHLGNVSTIIKVRLYTELALILLGIIGCFLPQKIGYVFTSLLSFFAFEYVLFYRILGLNGSVSELLALVIPLIIIILVNTKLVRKHFNQTKIYLNTLILIFGISFFICLFLLWGSNASFLQ